MKKFLLITIALLGLAALPFHSDSALAAPSIRILKAATGEEGVSSFTIPTNASRSSWPVYIALSEAPTATVNLAVSHTGAAILYWSGSNNLSFSASNWNQRRLLALEYQGNAQPGAKGKITISGNGVGSREIIFTVAGTSTGGDSTTGGSTSGGTSNGNVTKLAENITTEDLKGLGFADISFDSLFDRIILLLLIIIALAAFLSIIYSGYQYITSGGDAAQAAKARRNILWAIIGILIALLAYAAVRFVATLGDSGRINLPDSTTQTTTNTGSTSSNDGQTILVFDSSNQSPSTILLTDPELQITEQFALQLGTIPIDSVEVTATVVGKLPITVQPSRMTFTNSNWDQSQLFGISYNGTGQSGEAAEVILKTANGARYVVRVELP